ncbi:MAG: hypothetical protein ACRDTC_12985 [Pseudonocardiaceae bacterium]
MTITERDPVSKQLLFKLAAGQVTRIAPGNGSASAAEQCPPQSGAGRYREGLTPVHLPTYLGLLRIRIKQAAPSGPRGRLTRGNR